LVVSSTRHRPALDVLESRLAMSSSLPSDTIGVASGTVAAPGAVAEVSVPIAPENLAQHRHATVFGFSVQPSAGSSLIPEVVFARGANGARLPLRPGNAFVAGANGKTTVFARVGQSGTLTAGVTGRDGSQGSFTLRAYLPGDLTGTGQVTLADMRVFGASYLTTQNDALFNPAADANQNGQIGQKDGRFLVRNLTPLTPPIPLKADFILAPQDQAHVHGVSNSGGITLSANPTILGRTTPGAIVFAGSGLDDFSFVGPALATDAQGNFSIKVHNTTGLNNFDFLIVDPYGRQLVRAFPIVWLGFGKNQPAHPTANPAPQSPTE
jgi:hypothetical protein